MFTVRRRQNQYGRAISFVAGVAVGSRVMYLFDPVSGKRRRMWLRDKAVHARSVCSRALDKALRDLGNRAGGFLAQAWASLRHQAVPDEVLGERVRAKLGRVASHPNSIEVIASHGRVTLTGPILEREAERVVGQLYSVRGVRYVENKLEVHKEAGDCPRFARRQRLEKSPARADAGKVGASNTDHRWFHRSGDAGDRREARKCGDATRIAWWWSSAAIAEQHASSAGGRLG